MNAIPEKINKVTATKAENIRKVKYYTNINPNLSIDELAKLTDLHPATVRLHKKFIENSDLANEKFINPAADALLANLKNDNMAAVKLVYDHANRGNVSPVAGSNTTINISFDGMSNQKGSVLIESKTSDATRGATVDAELLRDGEV